MDNWQTQIGKTQKLELEKTQTQGNELELERRRRTRLKLNKTQTHKLKLHQKTQTQKIQKLEHSSFVSAGPVVWGAYWDIQRWPHLLIGVSYVR